MSVFKKVIEAHSQATTAAEHAAAAAVAARDAKQADFARSFDEQIALVASPIFEEFAKDAIDHGFPATTEKAVDGHGTPTYSLRLIPEEGAVLGAVPSKECVYVLRGLVGTQKVEHVYYYEQRPDRPNGIKRGEFGIQSINAEVLERELGEFLSASLKARAT